MISVWRILVIAAAFASTVEAGAVAYSYDRLNRLTGVAYPDGTTIAYTYDSAGNRLSQVIVNPSIPLPKVGVDKVTLTFSAAVGQTSGSQAIAVTNAGGGSLQWDAVATASWLSVTPGSGTNSGAVNVTASAAGMSAGTYNANVLILASASNPSVTIPVIFTVTPAQGNPSISSGGIVSAAGSSPGIARGSVASLYGTFLADGPSQATSAPLPRTLGNTQVAVNGVSAPLWYADSNQINFQVPFESPLQGQASVVVTHSGVPSSPMNVTLTPYAPSVFTYQRASGVFDPIIVHSADNQLVTPTDPAVPGEYLVVYGTGIGDLTVAVATDAFSPTSPVAAAKVTPTATIGGANALVGFAGLTPGGIGLAQFNIQVPNNLSSGSTFPLVINFNGATSPPVNVAVKSSGQQQPNVSLQLTDVEPQSPLATDNLTLNFAVKNPGHFQGNLDIKLYVSPSAQITAGTAQTGAPATLTLSGSDGSFTWSSVSMPSGLNPGTYSVAVGVAFSGNTDPNGVVLSSAMQVQIISQRPPFDLAVQLKDISPTLVGAGDPISVHFSVSEPGGISGTFTRSIYISTDPTNLSSGTLVNTRTFDLVKGTLDLTSTGNSIPRSLASGNYYIGVIVQTSGDTNPANNTSLALPIAITSQRTSFDIGVSGVSVTPSTIAPGGTFTVSYNITNTSKSTGIYQRWVYLSTDQTITTSDQLLSTGTFSLTGVDDQFTTAAITLPGSVAAGKYYLGVIVESQGDTNPSDNTSAGVAIQVGSSAGANAVSALDIVAPNSVSDSAGSPQDSRIDGDGAIAEPGGLRAGDNPKPVTVRQQ
jgi:uncharacterized protein (TIGR03437 family)